MNFCHAGKFSAPCCVPVLFPWMHNTVIRMYILMSPKHTGRTAALWQTGEYQEASRAFTWTKVWNLVIIRSWRKPWCTSLMQERSRVRNPDDHIRSRYCVVIYLGSRSIDTVCPVWRSGGVPTLMACTTYESSVSLWLWCCLRFSVSVKSGPSKSVFSFPSWK